MIQLIEKTPCTVRSVPQCRITSPPATITVTASYLTPTIRYSTTYNLSSDVTNYLHLLFNIHNFLPQSTIWSSLPHDSTTSVRRTKPMKSKHCPVPRSDCAMYGSRKTCHTTIPPSPTPHKHSPFTCTHRRYRPKIPSSGTTSASVMVPSMNTLLSWVGDRNSSISIYCSRSSFPASSFSVFLTSSP